MQLSIFLASFGVVVAIASTAIACDPQLDERTLLEIKSQSKRVAVDRQCRTINAGVYDELSLGPAIDLGNGRIQQVLGGSDQSRVLLADCNAREANILQGAEIKSGEDPCGWTSTYADLAGEKAGMKLDGGANLRELVELAAAKGVTEISPSEYFFMFRKVWELERYAVGGKDRFDLLCGCKVYYPDSAGARN